MHALKTLTLLRLEICCEKVNIWLTVSRRDSISKCQNVKRWSSPVWWSVLKNTHTGTSGRGCVSTYDHCYVCSIDWLLSFLLHCYLHTSWNFFFIVCLIVVCFAWYALSCMDDDVQIKYTGGSACSPRARQSCVLLHTMCKVSVQNS